LAVKRMNNKNTFSDHEVEDYERKRYRSLDQRLVHRREEKILKSCLKATGTAPGLALDVPCGYGRFTGLIEAEGLTPISSDYSPAMVRRTLRRSPGRGFVADAKKRLPLKDNAVDMVFSMRFLQHVHDAAERGSILAEFGRVSRSWVLVSFYQSTPLHRLQRLLRGARKKRKRSIRMLDRRVFERDVGRSGLRIIKVLPLLRGVHAQRIALLKTNPQTRSD
jgi:SAM-dependent methyltransferase